MKMPRYLVAGALALAFGLTAVSAQDDGEKKDKGPSKADLKKYDANHDGCLDETEKAKAKADKEAKRQAELDKYDANKDGKINKDEREQKKADAEAAKAAKKAEREAKKTSNTK
jgi:multidrug efflux pump subunit AcrA (membrane-fusion protein)